MVTNRGWIFSGVTVGDSAETYLVWRALVSQHAFAREDRGIVPYWYSKSLPRIRQSFSSLWKYQNLRGLIQARSFMPPSRSAASISECIALAKAHEEKTGKAPVLDPDFAEDVEEILSHRKQWNPPAWE